MKNNLSILFLLALTSCSQQNPIEKLLITKPNESWCYYSTNNSHNIYFKFDKNKTSIRYERDTNGDFIKYPVNIDTDTGFQKWSVSKDSIMNWGNFTYDVVSCNDKAIVLLYLTDEKPYTNYIFLIKEKRSDNKKSGGDYEQKKIFNPEKYRYKK
jgi:hypothetical protein